MRRPIAAAALAALAFALASPASAVDPVKTRPEFIVNEYTTGFQGFPRVAMHSSGSFVVVWDDYGRDGSYYGVFARRFDSTGSPIGGSFQVNTSTFDYQRLPAIGMDDVGNFVVVWDDYGQDGDGYGIVGQLFNSSGSKVGGEFVANTYTTNWQRIPDVSMDGSGNFVVVWASRDQDGDLYGVFGQRFSSAGAKVGGEFQVSSYTTDHQEYPRVSVSGTGEFVVVWESYGQDGSGDGIMAKMFDSSGAAVGGEFEVNSYTTFNQLYPVTAITPQGNFIVSWDSAVQDGSGAGVFMRRFDSAGNPQGGDLQVNTYTFYYQTLPSVAADANGGFVVVWNSFDQLGYGTYYDVFGQIYDPNGAAISSEFLVNTYTDDYQRIPTVAMNDSGQFVVVWDSFYQDGDYSGIFGQNFQAFDPNTAGGLDFTSPTDGSMVDCSDPRGFQPTFAWGISPFDQFRVFMGNDPLFPKGTAVKSGKWGAISTNSYTPPAKKWQSACKKTLTGDPNNAVMYLQVLGKGNDVSKRDPSKFGEGSVIMVDVMFPSTGILDFDFPPAPGTMVDCSNPAISQPTFQWSGGNFEGYKVFIGTDPAFPKSGTVKSGKWGKITTESWTVPAKKWQSACQKALSANMSSPVLYVQVQGKDNDLPSGYPGKFDSSPIVMIDPQY